MKNRYDGNLRKANQQINDLRPANTTLRTILAYEIKNICINTNCIVGEIGCGEGHLSEIIMNTNPEIELEVSDISKEMIDLVRTRLARHGDNVKFKIQSALEFLDNSPNKYFDSIVSSWVIHNFSKLDQKKVFAAASEKIKSNGALIIMEKVFPDDIEQASNMFSNRIARYRYLDKELQQEIITHEEDDFSEEHRMTNAEIISNLREAGFNKVDIVDRVECDVVVVARK